MPDLFATIRLLADGRFHSGEELGRRLGVSRAAVWKSIQSLRAADIEVLSVRGRGYRLARPLDLLDHEHLLVTLLPDAVPAVGKLEVFDSLSSTNQYLMDAATRGYPNGSVVLAERQELGRGRRGRRWISPFGANIYLSVLWRSQEGPARFLGLSVAVAVGVAQAMERLGVKGLQLKWPNDLVVDGRKLGGILLEVAGEASGPCHVVIGLGLNLGMPRSMEIDQPWIDLTELLPKASRNVVAGTLGRALLQSCDEFMRLGLTPFLSDWHRFDSLLLHPVSVIFPGKVVHGTSKGIDDSGRLLVQVGSEIQTYSSGEVSVRALDLA